MGDGTGEKPVNFPLGIRSRVIFWELMEGNERVDVDFKVDIRYQ